MPIALYAFQWLFAIFFLLHQCGKHRPGFQRFALLFFSSYFSISTPVGISIYRVILATSVRVFLLSFFFERKSRIQSHYLKSDITFEPLSFYDIRLHNHYTGVFKGLVLVHGSYNVSVMCAALPNGLVVKYCFL